MEHNVQVEVNCQRDRALVDFTFEVYSYENGIKEYNSVVASHTIYFNKQEWERSILYTTTNQSDMPLEPLFTDTWGYKTPQIGPVSRVNLSEATKRGNDVYDAQFVYQNRILIR